MRIREFVPSDYQSVICIHNTIYPSRPTTVEAWVEADQQRNPKCEHKRWVALQGEAIVGFGSYGQHVFDYHPRKFAIAILVLPDYQRRGIGSALYDQIMKGLQPFEPQTLRADGYGNLPEGIQFLQKRGFEPVFRETPLHLDVMSFDPSPYADLEARLCAQGIEIKTLRDLAGEPDRDRKVYDLFWEMTGDVPKEHKVPQMSFQEWMDWTLKDPLVPHDGYFIAVRGDEYIGISEFGKYRDSDALQAGLVGVKQAFRGRGIALAMQVRGIAYARENGHPRIKTSTGNVPMRSLYVRLGFVRQPEWIQFEKVCG